MRMHELGSPPLPISACIQINGAARKTHQRRSNPMRVASYTASVLLCTASLA